MPLGLSDNLFKRVVSAVTLLPFVLGLVYLGGWWFYVLLAVGGGLMMVEWCALTGVVSARARYLATTFILVSVAFLTYVGPGRPTAMIILILLLALTIPLFAIRPGKLSRNVANDTANNNALVGTAYVGLALISLTWLRGQDDNGMIVIWTFFVVWAMDVGGYFAGKGIGGPKLAPRLSPKKTWAGLVGGMVLAAAVSLAISLLFGAGDPLLMPLAGAIVALVAQLGDLYESAVKRALDKKDSGTLIPGHGGILDRVDGLIFSAPAVAFALAAAQIGGLDG